MVAVGSICVFLALVASAVESRMVSREEQRLSRGQNNRNVRSIRKASLASPRSLNSMLKQPILSFGSWFGPHRSKREHELPVETPEAANFEEQKEELLETIDNLLLNELKKEVKDDAEVVVGDNAQQNLVRPSRLRRLFGKNAVIVQL
ncbi:unnamed protein product [Bursaphelenchus xylophilus]|uniref:(pine wood nematode) hypothetical protein n=1 Tax=Bursaphelenchus xylophilus TaxID=6326 RepID=A0A1I7SG65_BURXY|nr:unnamed protein product [Bursaphelenchus xylophilus]CAG9119331.1 unnamed protein product [Bursaphelenchus xylophilus]